MKIYIACGLTQVPRTLFASYTQFIHLLALTLKVDRSNQVKYALADSDPQLATHPPSDRARLCYAWDRRMVEECDVLIAEASFPSTGLGIELQLADSREIPIILSFHDFGINRAAPIKYENPDHGKHDLQIGEGYVSLMALGLPNIASVINHTADQVGADAIVCALNQLRTCPVSSL